MNLDKFFILKTILPVMLLVSACTEKAKHTAEVVNKPYLELPGPEKWLSDWSKKNEVVVHMLTEPDNLHPTNGNSIIRSELFLYLHGSLLRTDLRTGTILPAMCKSMPVLSKDNLEMEFELRDGLKWDDGSPVLADDVIFTVKASMNPLTNNPGMKPYFSYVKSVNVVPDNPRKFIIKMNSVYIQNIALWADYPIFQKKFFDPDGVLDDFTFEQFGDTTFKAEQADHGNELIKWSADFNSEKNGFQVDRISGLGPYKIVSWQEGQMIVLEKKKNHWSATSNEYTEKAGPDRIIFKVDKDPVTQELAFMKQEMDATTSISTRVLLKLKADSMFNRNFHGNFVDIYGYTFVGMNMKPDESGRALALKEKDVRRALALLTPVDDIIRVVNKGVNKRVTGAVSKFKASCNTQLPLIPLDLNQANQLLDKSGWTARDQDGVRMKQINGQKQRLEFEIIYNSSIVEWQDMAMMIGESFKKAGIKLNLSAVDLNAWLEKGTSHDFDLIMGTWNSTALPEEYTQLWSSKSWKENGLNFTGFGDAASDALGDSISITMDENRRKEMEWRMQKKIYDEYAYVFLYGLVRRTIIHKRFNHVELYAERPGVLYNIMSVSPGVGNVPGVAP
jgi:peptide/nickel transport system substrate-binding protein